MVRVDGSRPASSSVVGFTLIELVVAIAVLGIVAALVIPRLINLSREARIAAVVYAARTLASTAAAVHHKAALAGIPADATVRQVDIGGGEMIDVRYGYPACTADGIVKASGTTKGYVWYIGTDSASCTLYPDAGKNGSGNPIYMANCGVVYVNTQGTTWNPTTTGC